MGTPRKEVVLQASTRICAVWQKRSYRLEQIKIVDNRGCHLAVAAFIARHRWCHPHRTLLSSGRPPHVIVLPCSSGVIFKRRRVGDVEDGRGCGRGGRRRGGAANAVRRNGAAGEGAADRGDRGWGSAAGRLTISKSSGVAGAMSCGTQPLERR